MQRIPMARIVFTNNKVLELDLTVWSIDKENSNDGVLIFYNDEDEMFTIVASNVNFIITYFREHLEIGDPPPPKKRLDYSR